MYFIGHSTRLFLVSQAAHSTCRYFVSEAPYSALMLNMPLGCCSDALDLVLGAWDLETAQWERAAVTLDLIGLL